MFMMKIENLLTLNDIKNDVDIIPLINIKKY